MITKSIKKSEEMHKIFIAIIMLLVGRLVGAAINLNKSQSHNTGVYLRANASDPVEQSMDLGQGSVSGSEVLP